MNVSVIIATYNRIELLQKCLTAVLNQTHPAYEIIVVDDGSTDETAAIITEYFPTVKFLHYPENRGPAAARNYGIQEASGKIIAFTDDDCIPPQNWLAQLVAGFQKYPNAGAIGGIQLPSKKKQRASILARYEAFVSYKVYNVGHEVIIDQPAPGGTNNLAIPRSVFDHIGHFDTRFPVAAGEDADLLHRIAAAGYDTVCLPTAVSHFPNYTLSSFFKQQIRRGIGAAYFSQKYGQQRALPYEVVRLILSPLIFFQNIWKYRQLANAFLHTIAGGLQTVGRLQGRRALTQTPKHVWQSSASPTKLSYLQRFAVGRTVLDTGSGAGFYSNWLTKQGFNVTAVDRHPSGRSGRYLIQGDLTALPFNEQFDTVLCFDVLEHVADENAALEELRRLTHKRLILSVPNENDEILRRHNLTYKHHVDKTHFREYRLSELKSKLEQKGFEILYSNLEGPVNPALLADFVRPSWLQPMFRFIIKSMFKLHLFQNKALYADIYIVADTLNIHTTES